LLDNQTRGQNMIEACKLSAVEAAHKIKSGDLTSEQLIKSCLERATERIQDVGAWAHIDPVLAVLSARDSDQAGNQGLLGGVPVGVKDIINTKAMPTSYGSSIYGLNQPKDDADCVKNVKRQGGIVLGKTVTTEFAWRNPGKTKNPHNPAHTPGGSSSGSAAGVADYQMPLAFGTQTAGSVIRPAAYCGVVGFKPTIGTHDRNGVKELSNYLDTLGTFGRSVEDVSFFDYALRGKPAPSLSIFAGRPPKFGLMVPFRGDASNDALSVLETAGGRAEESGAKLIDIPSSTNFEKLADIQTVIMLGDAGKSLAWEYEYHPERLIQFYKDSIATGQSISKTSLSNMKRSADEARLKYMNLFDEIDVILTLSSADEAPEGTSFTGDPLFNRVWTLLGWPCVTIPFGFGAKGLPIGVQVIGPTGMDSKTLAAAAWLEKVFSKN
jgi:Asp-tRNA(Asn)/Glu-tRNA(Gln) amidotransferase A subunit family amidase